MRMGFMSVFPLDTDFVMEETVGFAHGCVQLLMELAYVLLD